MRRGEREWLVHDDLRSGTMSYNCRTTFYNEARGMMRP